MWHRLLGPPSPLLPERVALFCDKFLYLNVGFSKYIFFCWVFLKTFFLNLSKTLTSVESRLWPHVHEFIIFHKLVLENVFVLIKPKQKNNLKVCGAGQSSRWWHNHIQQIIQLDPKTRHRGQVFFFLRLHIKHWNSGSNKEKACV